MFFQTGLFSFNFIHTNSMFIHTSLFLVISLLKNQSKFECRTISNKYSDIWINFYLMTWQEKEIIKLGSSLLNTMYKKVYIFNWLVIFLKFWSNKWSRRSKYGNPRHLWNQKDFIFSHKINKYRHSLISAVSISAIFDLVRFIILSYFPPL